MTASFLVYQPQEPTGFQHPATPMCAAPNGRAVARTPPPLRSNNHCLPPCWQHLGFYLPSGLNLITRPWTPSSDYRNAMHAPPCLSARRGRYRRLNALPQPQLQEVAAPGPHRHLSPAVAAAPAAAAGEGPRVSPASARADVGGTRAAARYTSTCTRVARASGTISHVLSTV